MIDNRISPGRTNEFLYAINNILHQTVFQFFFFHICRYQTCQQQYNIFSVMWCRCYRRVILIDVCMLWAIEAWSQEYSSQYSEIIRCSHSFTEPWYTQKLTTIKNFSRLDMLPFFFFISFHPESLSSPNDRFQYALIFHFLNYSITILIHFLTQHYFLP